jgi:hypothetical protein
MTEIKMVQIAGPVNIASETGSFENVRAVETTVAVVRKLLSTGGKKLRPGAVLDPSFVAKLSRDAKRVLCEQGYIELMPVSLELQKG